MRNTKAQLTIFIIIAIILIGGIVIFFTYKDSLIGSGIPANLEPVYTSFLSCLEGDTLIGVDILESQAGYIELPTFDSGSEYMPFSSQLNFLGSPVPYWYYVSGNNIQREQVPSKTEMENQLGEFVSNKIRGCILDDYYLDGFEVVMENPETEIDIRDNEVRVNLKMDLSISRGDESAVVKNHRIDVKSDLGTLYDSAIEVYDYEQENLFLENYAVDTLRLYAPVDGVELTCSPLTWSGDKVFDELQEAIEINTLALKVKGGDYSLNKKENEYFVVDVPSKILKSTSRDVRFINSKDWPSSFEVTPSEESIMISSPVGNQPGMGVLGFCYVPYHFVYNVKYPVLVQIYSGNEIFQFPLAVVLQGNVPREALDVSAVGFEDSGLCDYKNMKVEVNTYDVRMNSVPSEISYECFNEVCRIGSTTTNPLVTNFPQCVNGRIVAKSEGYVDAKYVYSTTESGSVDIILDRLYELNIDLKLDGNDYGKDAIINFISDDSSKTVVYPEQKSVKLSEGQYEVDVYVYRNSSIKLDAMTREQCMEVPQTGLSGLFGLTSEQCFSIDIPSQVISNALAGGGKENYYILESELSGSSTIEINAESLDIPKSLEQLQDNYMLFEDKGLEVFFR